MSKLRKSLRSYLALRRALGFKLDRRGGSYIGLSISPKSKARRLSRVIWPFSSLWRLPMGSQLFARNGLQIVRTFAEYQAGVDPRTEVHRADCCLMAI